MTDQPESALRASVPDVVHVLVRLIGHYEQQETLVRAYTIKSHAESDRLVADEQWRDAIERVGDNLDYPDEPASEEDWAKWERRRNRAWAKFRRLLTIDPGAAPVRTWSSPEEPRYFLCEVPLATQAIEARRAETGTGSVHESSHD